ncbi:MULTISPECIES: alpha/beta hydrolase [Nocardia]|uniref:alpha/beta hydrolase n=1 Tax=Nocardia TaxID=1817 RepID=UPI0018959743|nr:MULTISPECIES: alpha/beta hydrolase family protein [Nocardia]MBF6348397.1 esterase family protein [Nocardia flavorosea]
MSSFPRVPRRAAALLTAAAFLTLGTVASTAADPGASIVSRTPGTGRSVELTVYSPSMQRDIALQVLRPADTETPAPTLYLLNGAGGGEDAASWSAQTDLAGFFADKHVNVVVPLEGAFSYYTDWQRPDPGLAENLGNNGRNMWATFLTEELPPVIDTAFGTTGANAIAGISMAATSVLDLTIRAPELYRAAAAYSGCAMTSDPLGRAFVTLVVSLGGGDSENMWGPVDGPGWREHDPYLHADRLPDIPMYISSGTGLPGRYDTATDPRLRGDQKMLWNQLLVGGGIEAAADYCTRALQRRTQELGRTDIVFDLRPAGTHSWGYWEDDLHRSWPLLAAALGV